MQSTPTSVAGRRAGRPALLFSALATLLGAVAGCGGEGDGGARVGQLERPLLGPTAPLPPLPEARAAELAIPAEIAPWDVAAGEVEVVERPVKGRRIEEGAPVPRALMLRGRKPKRLRIPGPFPLERFTRVVLEVKVYDATTFTVQLLRGGKAVLGSEPARVGLGREPQAVVVDLPHARTVDGPVDELRVLISAGGILRLDRVTLLEAPVEGWLPRADEAPRLVHIEGESRRARALTSAVPWSGSARVPRGGELRYSYGVPRFLHLPGPGAVQLVVRAEDEDGERVEARHALDDLPAEPRWHAGRLDLSALAGREARLSLALEPPPGAPADLLALCAVGELALAAPGAAAPTVLLVTSDTHRADYMGLSGRGVEVRTPNLDALAARGVWFEDCFASTNITNPSHIALMTATHPRDVGILNNSTPVSELAPTLAERFREAGFVTWAALSTRHLGDDVSGLGQGFERMSWPDAGDRDGSQTLAQLERWLPEAEGLPLFVWLHSFDAHTPYEPPPEYAGLYYEAGRDAFDPTSPTPPEERFLPAHLRGLRDLEWPEAMYRGEISFLDTSLGRLFDRARFRDGVVAFTADHGESLGQHGVYFDHGDLYPDTVHVPLILAWPDAPAGRRVSEPVRQIDVGRTLLDLAGLGSAEFPGRDLREVVEGGGSGEPRFTLAANFTSAAMTWRGKHLIFHLRAHSEHNRAEPAAEHSVELYDLEADPACTRDLLDEEPELAAQMRAALMRWLGDAQDLGWAMESRGDSRLREQLMRLGYTDDGGGASLSQYVDPDCSCEWCQRFR